MLTPLALDIFSENLLHLSTMPDAHAFCLPAKQPPMESPDRMWKQQQWRPLSRKSHVFERRGRRSWNAKSRRKRWRFLRKGMWRCPCSLLLPIWTSILIFSRIVMMMGCQTFHCLSEWCCVCRRHFSRQVQTTCPVFFPLAFLLHKYHKKKYFCL